MSFDSPAFVLLLITSMVIVRLSYGIAGTGLLAVCALFYSYAGAFDFALFAAIIIVNWGAALVVRRTPSTFWLAVAGNVAILAFFKYREMFLPDAATQGYARIAIPLGISFYLFHILAYLADLRSGRAQLVGLHKFALFVAFFPHLIAGPIVRARQLLPQLQPLWRRGGGRRHLLFFGLALCLMGLVKKVVFANSLAPVVDNVFRAVPGDAVTAWAGAWLFGFQIYFDFSGYTDIALGAAMLLGLRLPTNFLTPYLSADPREFWRRWHISLSLWIRDYLYVPLGGNRGGTVRPALVLVSVMALAGLWHGANWTFVAWGVLWGLYILLWRLAAPYLAPLPFPLRWTVHIAIVMVLWVFFRAPDIDFALRYIARMFSFSGRPFDTGLLFGVLGCALLMALHAIERLTQRKEALLLLKRSRHPLVAGAMIALCLLLVFFPNYDVNPFIYFRF